LDRLDCTFQLQNRFYEASPYLAGQPIEARFDPLDAASVEIYFQGQPQGMARLVGPVVNAQLPSAKSSPAPHPEPTGINFVELPAQNDDASRLIPHAQFYAGQGLEAYLDCCANRSQLAVCRCASTWITAKSTRSPQLTRITASMGMLIVHTPPYQREGRGKIECFSGRVGNSSSTTWIASRRCRSTNSTSA
jgi:hypothetical protein